MKKRFTAAGGMYLLAQFILCAMIPHLALFLLQADSISASLTPFQAESCANFFVCQWMPFWLVFLPYLQVAKTDRCSVLSAIAAAGIVLTYLPGFARRSVMTIALTIPLLLAVDLFPLLKKAEDSSSRFLGGIAADRRILCTFFFWSVVFPCINILSCEACTWERTIVSPFQMLPVPGVLLFDVFRHQKVQPPTVWSIPGMLMVVPLSLYLVTIGPMAQFKVYHLMCLGIGYGFLFLMLVVYNMDQWKEATHKHQ